MTTALEFSQTTCMALNPELRMLNDVNRAVILKRPRPYSERDAIFCAIPPSQAIILALMDGKRTLGEVGQAWGFLTGQAEQEASRELSRLMGALATGNFGRGEVMVQVDDTNRSLIHAYDPLAFVMPTDAIDLTHRRLHKPNQVLYLPTLFCPQDCVYCYAKKRTTLEADLLPLERLEEIGKELVDLGVEAIELSGGDPLAHPRIFEIIRTFRKLGLATDVPTKFGASLADLYQLKELGVHKLQISLDSVDPGILDLMVGIPGYAQHLFRFFEHTRQAGMRVRINAVITPLNVHTIGALLDFAGRQGNVVSVALSPYGRSLFRHDDALFLEESALEHLQEEVDRRREQYPFMRMSVGATASPVSADPAERAQAWHERSYCSANRDGFVLLPNGHVTACEELYDHPAFRMGNLAEQSVMEMWNSPEAFALIHPDPSTVPDGPCNTCGEFQTCNAFRGRCWRNVLKAYGLDKPHYPDSRCPLAPPGARL